jgi:hypothetical protein
VTSEIPPRTAAHGSHPSSAEPYARFAVIAEIWSAWASVSSDSYLTLSQVHEAADSAQS